MNNTATHSTTNNTHCPVSYTHLDKVILTGAELSKYFGKETTPREMKDQIIKLLDNWKGQQKEHEKPEKKNEQEK